MITLTHHRLDVNAGALCQGGGIPEFYMTGRNHCQRKLNFLVLVHSFFGLIGGIDRPSLPFHRSRFLVFAIGDGRNENRALKLTNLV
jgi:hypothetical protein